MPGCVGFPHALVALCYVPDVGVSLLVALGALPQAGRVGHACVHVEDQLEPRRVERRRHRVAGRRVDLADGVELIRLVVAGGLVAAPLLGDDVHDHRGTVVLGQLQRLLQRDQIVPVDGTEVLDVEVRVQRLVVREAREEAVCAAADAAVDGAPGAMFDPASTSEARVIPT